MTDATEPPEIGEQAGTEPQIDPEIARKLAQLRTALRENFGAAVQAMMQLPRYRSQMLADLQPLVLDPMLKDRVAFAYQERPEGSDADMLRDASGFAIWANVSEEVDARIREQIAQGVFPVRLKPEDWTSGEINWLFDVVAPNQATTAAVIAGFRKVAKGGELRLHPLITRLVDRETLEKMGARRSPGTAVAQEPAEA